MRNGLKSVERIIEKYGLAIALAILATTPVTGAFFVIICLHYQSL